MMKALGLRKSGPIDTTKKVANVRVGSYRANVSLPGVDPEMIHTMSGAPDSVAADTTRKAPARKGAKNPVVVGFKRLGKKLDELRHPNF